MEELLNRIDEMLTEDPHAAAELVEEILEQTRDDVGRLAARVFCVWGGYRRIQGDWEMAEGAYVLAKHLLLIGGGREKEWIDWHGRMAFLRRDQRRLAAAEVHAQEAVDLSRILDDPQLLAQARVDLALVQLYKNAFESAKAGALEALQVLTPENRRYYRTAVHTVLACLCRDTTEDPGEELTLWLERARAIGDTPDSFPGTKLRWLEGLALSRRGRWTEAVAPLGAAYDALLQHGAYVNAATCALDLAEACLEAGDMDTAATVAGKLFPVLAALRHRREALSALRIFCRAAEGRTLDVDLVREVRRRLEGTA